MNSADFVFGGSFVRPRHPRSPRDTRNSPGLSEISEIACDLRFEFYFTVCYIRNNLVERKEGNKTA